IKFIVGEYPTGRMTRGYIDTLGIDENARPAIIEYKRGNNENVISQGLYYLDWLLDHQAEFENLVKRKLELSEEIKIDFAGTRIICVASGFSRFDVRAICQIGKNIELVRYRFYGDDLLFLELLESPVSAFVPERDEREPGVRDVGMPPAMQLRVKNMAAETEALYLDLLSFAESLGEDVSIRFLKHYIAFARRRHFACAQPLKNVIKLWINLDPAEFVEEGFSRDVSRLGHHATGDLEIDIHSREDLSRAKPVIELAYQKN
ncbi:MAG: hypothetical protein K2H64_11710, partial [Desulfovibrio sp.]|nr:hypothetical protein [Desulfovibrio sp.]